MTCSSPRAALAVWMFVGLAAGCGSGHSNPPAPPPKGAVTAEDLEKTPSEPIEKVLQAKVPGLVITSTSDGGIAVQIRGAGSFYSSDAPLYIVDDVPFTPGPGGALTGINPHDIDWIKVLKNPEDTGLYGMRGSNGVIVIKTKSPGRRPP